MKLLSSSIIVLAGSVITFGVTHTTSRYDTFFAGFGGFAVCLIGLGGWFDYRAAYDFDSSSFALSLGLLGWQLVAGALDCLRRFTVGDVCYRCHACGSLDLGTYCGFNN